MTDTLSGRSPVHHLLEALGARWGQTGRTPLALDFGEPQAEASAARTLGLSDVSALSKLGVKGKRSASWLKEQGVDVPEEVYEVRDLNPEGVVARIGRDEFLLEDGIRGASVAKLSESPVGGSVYRQDRQDATFLLSGARARDLLAQVCGVDFREVAPRRLIYTRVAVVSAAVIFDPIEGLPVYRLWVDSTYAEYLWEHLSQIATELGGRVVGAECLMTKA